MQASILRMSGNLIDDTQPAERRIGIRLAAAATLCFAFAGGLLWWRQGEAIFGAYVTAALAWCF